MTKSRRYLVLLFFLIALTGIFAVPGLVRKLKKISYPMKYYQTVEHYAEEYEMDPMMIYAVIRTESGFDEKAQSDVGARGLMQITEETFAWIKLKIASDEPLEFDDLWDPEVNIRFGSYYLDCCLERYAGDLATACAGYHSGWGTVDRLLEDPAYAATEKTLAEFPYPQMARYVQKVSDAYQEYVQLYRS